MGSWVELDAYYPPGTLTPAAALVVALGHLAGARSAYTNPATGELANFWPRGPRGIAPDHDLAARVEHSLAEVPFDAFLAEARERLNPGQRRALLLNVLDAALAQSSNLTEHSQVGALAEALGATPEWLARARELLEQKNDLSIFSQ